VHWLVLGMIGAKEFAPFDYCDIMKIPVDHSPKVQVRIRLNIVQHSFQLNVPDKRRNYLNCIFQLLNSKVL